MAQPRYCSVEDCPLEASVLITFLDNGTTLDYCSAHFGQFVMTSAAEIGMVWPEDPEPEPETPAPIEEARAEAVAVVAGAETVERAPADDAPAPSSRKERRPAPTRG